MLLDDRLRKEFLGGAKAKEGEVVSKFIGLNKENMLKRKPKVLRPSLDRPAWLGEISG